MRPPLEDELLDEALLEVEEEAPSKFKIICSLLLAFRLNVICCAFEPWLPMLSETCSPLPLVGLLILIVISSGVALFAPLLRLRTISGPALALAALALSWEGNGSTCAPVVVPLVVVLLVAALLRLIIISGPALAVTGLALTGLALSLGGNGSTCCCAPFLDLPASALKACWAPARSPDCKACPTAAKSCSRWLALKGFPLANGPPCPSDTILL